MGTGKIFKIIVYLPVLAVMAFVVIINAFFYSSHSETSLFNFIKTIITVGWLLGTFYFFYFFLVKMFLRKRKVIEFLVFSVIACFLISAITFYLQELNKFIFDYKNVQLSLKGWGIYSLYTAITGSLAILYRFSIDWFINLNLKDKIENLQLKNEIIQLKTKLNPHFLFNTINNIDTLIETDSKHASEYLGKLSSILRYIIYDTEKEKVELNKELTCLKDYIDLQKIRIPVDSIINLTIDNEMNKLQISPSLLTPFVENIFKHADWNDARFESKIEIKIKDGILQYRSRNKIAIDSLNNRKTEGIGIATTKKRLELLYPDLHKFDIKTIDDIYIVNLEINLNEN